jgi:hypothetical protein
LGKVVIDDLAKKKERIMELHGLIFEPTFWDRFTTGPKREKKKRLMGSSDNRGKPISLSVLGLSDSLSTRLMHPLLIVLNNKLERLWGVDELISEFERDPSSPID